MLVILECNYKTDNRMKLIMSDKPLKFKSALDKDTKYVDLSTARIANCMGCFGCWTKTPGKCIIRDDAPQIYPLIAQSTKVLYVSHIKYGGYDTPMKTMLERAIPIQQAFIRIYRNETHHVQRNVAMKEATIIAYGNLSEEEKSIFRELVGRNAHNMNFHTYNILFTTEAMIHNLVNDTLNLWKE